LEETVEQVLEPWDIEVGGVGADLCADRAGALGGATGDLGRRPQQRELVGELVSGTRN
jgi:hypothetical protein